MQQVAVRRLNTADYYQVLIDSVGNMNENVLHVSNVKDALSCDSLSLGIGGLDLDRKLEALKE